LGVSAFLLFDFWAFRLFVKRKPFFYHIFTINYALSFIIEQFFGRCLNDVLIITLVCSNVYFSVAWL